MELLITKTTVADVLQVAIGYDEKEFNNFIREAQMFDLKPLIREEFFADLLANKTTPEFEKVFQGGSYDHNGRNYSFLGLDAVLAFFTYARYYVAAPGVATSHGIVIKSNPHSTPVPLEDRRNTYYKKREEANLLFKDLSLYIERNISNFPSFNNVENCTNNDVRGSFNSFVIK